MGYINVISISLSNSAHSYDLFVCLISIFYYLSNMIGLPAGVSSLISHSWCHGSNGLWMKWDLDKFIGNKHSNFKNYSKIEVTVKLTDSIEGFYRN